MNFNKHYDLKGKHALLGGSNYHWINYTDERFDEVVYNMEAKERGTALHDYAETAIRLGRKQPKNADTINAYVNDAIAYHMQPEVPLYYSDIAFGTADSISYDEHKKFLRIHDLKTGTISPGHMEQLMIYAAYFCLEYGVNPEDIGIELRIYQNSEVIVHNPDPIDIRSIMDTTIRFNKRHYKRKYGKEVE